MAGGAVRYGVIGAGRMGGVTMLRLMADHPAARPVAFFEAAPDRPDTAERLVELQAAGIERCASLDALLARDDVDIILNVTPHFAHAETTVAALRAGHDVLCEKPPACSRAECQAMIDAQRATGRRLLVHFQHMLRPTARRLKQAICRGELGRIRRVRCLSLWWRNSEYYRRVDWAGRRLWQGRPTYDGVLANQASHYLNQMLAFAHRGGPGRVARPAELRAGLYRFHPADAMDAEDTAVAVGTLDNDDRTEFCFAATTCAAEAAGENRLAEYFGTAETHRIVIEGDRGSAEWDGVAELRVDGRPPQTFDAPDGAWPFYFHVQRVLAGQEEPLTPITEAVNTMEFIFRAYDATAGQIAPVPWPRHDEVGPALRRCFDQCRLPADLAEGPQWG